MSVITIYRQISGRWTLDPTEGATSHEAEVADGYFVDPLVDAGRPVCRDDRSDLRLEVERALRWGVLRVLTD